MAKDRFLDRFRKRLDKEKIGDLSKRGIPQDELSAEEEMIRETKKVDPIKAEQTVGRNAPCPCGSGKKFKKCCWGKKEQS